MTECPTGILIEFEEEEVKKKPSITRFAVPRTPVIVSSFRRTAGREKHPRGLTYTVSDCSDEDVSLLENETFDFDACSPVRSLEPLNYEEVFEDPEGTPMDICHRLRYKEDTEPKLSIEELDELFNEAIHLATELELQSSVENSNLQQRTVAPTDGLDFESSCVLEVSISSDNDDIHVAAQCELENTTGNCKSTKETSIETSMKPDDDQDSDEKVCLKSPVAVVDIKVSNCTSTIVENSSLSYEADIAEGRQSIEKANAAEFEENPNEKCIGDVSASSLEPSAQTERAKLVDYSCDTPDSSPRRKNNDKLLLDCQSCQMQELEGHSFCSSPDTKSVAPVVSAVDSTLPLIPVFNLDAGSDHVEEVNTSAIHVTEAEPVVATTPSVSGKPSATESLTPELAKCSPLNPSSCTEYPCKLSLPRIHSTPILQTPSVSAPRTVTKSTSVTNVRDLRLRKVSSSSSFSERNISVSSTISDDTSPVSSGSSSCSISTAKSGLPKPKLSGLLRPGFSNKTSISSSNSSIGSTSSGQRLIKIPEGSRSQPLQRKAYTSAAQPSQKPSNTLPNQVASGKALPSSRNPINKKVPLNPGEECKGPVRRVQSFREPSTSTASLANKAPATARVQKSVNMPPPQPRQQPTRPLIAKGQRDHCLSTSSSNSSIGTVTPTRNVVTSTPQQGSPASIPSLSFATPSRPNSRLSLAATPRSEQSTRRRSLAPSMSKDHSGQKSNSSQSSVGSCASPVNTHTARHSQLLKTKRPAINKTSNKENIQQKK